MLSNPIFDEKAVFSRAEKALREKYYISAKDMSEMKEEASNLTALSKPAAESMRDGLKQMI